MTEKSLPQPASSSSANTARGRTFTPYVLIWAGLATLSLVYLGLLAAQPAMVAGVLGAAPQQQTANAEEDAAHKQALGEAVAEVRTLRDTLDQFRSELIEIRAQVTNQGDATREVANRIATLETDPTELQRLAKDATAKNAAQVKAAKAAEAAAHKAEAAQKLAAEKAAGDAKKTAKAPGIETGSVAQPAAGAAITFGPPTVTPTPAALPPAPSAGKLIGVQIATGPSVDSLRLSWTLLNERHGDSFRSLEPRYTTEMSGSEQTYDLVVGPLASTDEARRLCQELAMKATPCTISRFTGDAL
ncbi:hypothetical protein [Hyphomicrobium sp. LHD-15]|uniref:hypothetical protein n=1 Tax=Hyphomicrobium sp. LHD-15 TaxID=3072142 RepID=UPI002810398B|nr:hypothetical protein [Hyphomicrobium sp. LHD-15]MDQ8699690.1 hypothetical protein [Hyphomicrobium sp. LHD-15]